MRKRRAFAPSPSMCAAAGGSPRHRISRRVATSAVIVASPVSPRSRSRVSSRTVARMRSWPRSRTTVASTPCALLGTNVVLSATANASGPSSRSPGGNGCPRPQRPRGEQDGLELAAAVGEPVDGRGARRRERGPLDHVDVGEVAQALGEDVGGRAGQAVAQVGEALRAEQQLPDDQQRPAVADRVQGAGDPAGISVRPHGVIVACSFQLCAWRIQLVPLRSPAGTSRRRT